MTELKRILYVDDESDIREVATMVLETLGGYAVEKCASGNEALAKAAAFAPDLILLDVMMPGLDGPSTLAELRRNPATAHIPAIFMTAKVQAHEIEEYLALGAKGVITKPFDSMTLCDQIGKICKS